ncbi:PhzF family phenazine biosynthesis protein, partial [Actinacidiphila rubida]|uniref:PhzF family phenazine biosynthesis protein n=1 Tax=Actinacidiphila rubida TaxID=310780 RepID=UPI0009A07B47
MTTTPGTPASPGSSDSAGPATAPATAVLRYTAFSRDPAGVVLDASGLDDAQMLAIAAEVGYSETAFVTSREERILDVKYFSAKAEVSFCGHATVATAVALSELLGPGDLLFRTVAGDVPVSVTAGDDGSGALRATLTSVEPHMEDASDATVDEALAALGWTRAELDPGLPPRIAYAGARHLVLAAATRERLAALDYDFERLAALMRSLDLTTLQLVWRESPEVYHVRDPFPVGGVVEDPATGAA